MIEDYSDPDTVRCPSCDVSPGQPCNPKPRFGETHVSRRRVPRRYECEICGRNCYRSSATGLMIHGGGYVSEDHSATPKKETQNS